MGPNQEQEKKQEYHYKNEGQDMTPVFCTAEVSASLLAQVLKSGKEEEYSSLVILDTTSAKKIMERESSMESVIEVLGESYTQDDTFQSPFLGWEIPRIYSFVKSHIRSLEESTEQANGWTHFTFIIVDSTTIQDNTVRLCYDGPDYGEGHDDVEEIILKAARVSLDDGLVSLLQTTETLTGILSDHVGGYQQVFSQQPPAGLETFEGAEPGQYKIAPPRRARRNKRDALLEGEKLGMVDIERIALARSLRIDGPIQQGHALHFHHYLRTRPSR